MADARPMTCAGAQRPTHTGRRAVLGALAALAAGSARAAGGVAALMTAPPTEPFPDRVTILVAGPQAGRMDRWANAIAPCLTASLPSGTSLRTVQAGGADGVTAANRFDARVAPDGGTALLLPGETPLAWLTGDPRTHFDAACWLPVMTALTPGVLASRVPATALRPGMHLRVATSVPAGPELAALLGLELMGIEPVPAFGLHDAALSLRALQGYVVDAVFLTGPSVAALLAEAAAAGAAPLFTLGVPAEGGMQRDPLLPLLPTVPELVAALRGGPPGGALAGAWRAAAAAAQMEFTLVLPPLTPAALVAPWRRAGAEASQALQPRMPGVRLLGAPEANVATAAVAADPDAVLELRRWLAARFNWTPS